MLLLLISGGVLVVIKKLSKWNLILKWCYCSQYCFVNAVVVAFCGGKKIKNIKEMKLFWKSWYCFYIVLEMLLLLLSVNWNKTNLILILILILMIITLGILLPENSNDSISKTISKTTTAFPNQYSKQQQHLQNYFYLLYIFYFLHPPPRKQQQQHFKN